MNPFSDEWYQVCVPVRIWDKFQERNTTHSRATDERLQRFHLFR